MVNSLCSFLLQLDFYTVESLEFLVAQIFLDFLDPPHPVIKIFDELHNTVIIKKCPILTPPPLIPWTCKMHRNYPPQNFMIPQYCLGLLYKTWQCFVSCYSSCVTGLPSMSSMNRVLKTSFTKLGWYLQALSQSGQKFTSQITGWMVLSPEIQNEIKFNIPIKWKYLHSTVRVIPLKSVIF